MLYFYREISSIVVAIDVLEAYGGIDFVTDGMSYVV
jgi:hypothetical protein